MNTKIKAEENVLLKNKITFPKTQETKFEKLILFQRI